MRKLLEALSLGETIVGCKAFRLAQIQSLGLLVKEAIILSSDEVLAILADGLVASELLKATHDNLDFKSGLAVRSSAVGEDGALSWAGQFKSRLFVNQEELEPAILDCAAALNSEAVKTYAGLHGVNSDQLALILQEMVPAEVAGVLFTHHPVTQDDKAMVIEVVAGVAEGLVSGQTEPKRYYVDATTGELLSEEGALTPSLSSHQLCELVSVGRKLRDFFGTGQDIEWAIEQETGLLYLNQSRNITTNGKTSVVQEVIASVRSDLRNEEIRLERLGCSTLPDALSDQNVSELLTPHPTQMSFGLFTYCFAHGQGAIRTARNQMGYDIGEELETGFFQLVAGQPRCSIVHDAFTYRIKGVPLDDYCRLVDYYLSSIKENPSLGNYPEVQLYQQNPDPEFLAKIFGTARAKQYALAYHQFFTSIRGLEDTLQKESQVALAEWDSNISHLANEASSNICELQRRYFEACELLRTQACLLFVKVTRLGFFSFTRLRNLLRELFGEDGEGYLNVLTGGVSPEDNPNLQFNADLRLFRQGQVTLDTVLVRYGHLASHELEISTPRYHDQPQLLVELSEKLGLLEPDYADAQAKVEELLRDLAARVGSESSNLCREVRAVRTYLPLREAVKFHFLKGYALLRQLAVQMEQRLQWPDGLIFHLNPEEVFRLCENEDEMRKLATERSRKSKQERKVEVPPIMFADQLEEIGKYTSANSDVLRGIGVTNAITEGEVVVVRNLTDSEPILQLCQGKVLVTITTDPAWSPVLVILGAEGGLITEVGGLLAHGAIYAREMNIAAVLNVQRATQILKTGMRVRVNGPKGIVEILP